jgi:hypothetical protein
MPNSTRPFKLNWASGGGLADRRLVLHSTLEVIPTYHLSAVMTAGPNIPSLSVISAQKSTNSSSFPSFKAASHHANLPKL